MKRLAYRLYFLLLILFPTQLGKHFWLTESLVLGRKIDYLSPALYLTDILVLFFITVVFWQIRPRLSRGWLYSLLILLLLIIISLINSGGTLLSFYMSLKVFEWWCFAWCIAVLRPPTNITISALSIAAIWSSFLALWQFLAQHSLNGIWYWLGERSFSANTPGIAQLSVGGKLFLRPYATFTHPNVLGGVFVLLLSLLLLIQIRTKWGWVLQRAAQGFLLLGVVLSFSRSAWAAMAFVFIAFFIKKNWVNKYWRALLFVGILAFIVEEALVGRFINLFQVDQVSLQERQQLIFAALRLWSGSPVFGIGIGRFISLLPTVSSPPFVLQPVHSIVVLWVVETGILGMITGFIFLIALFKKALLNKKTYLLIAWIALLLLGINDHYWLTVQQGQMFFSLLVGLTFARYS